MPFFKIMSDNMKKTIMLKKNYEFRKSFSVGKHYYERHIEIFISNNNNKINKLGVAVSKKVANSVKRHKIRRLIMENYRLIENEIKCGKNIIFMWKKNAKIDEANFYTIQEEMFKLLNKAGVINRGNE